MTLEICGLVMAAYIVAALVISIGIGKFIKWSMGGQ